MPPNPSLPPELSSSHQHLEETPLESREAFRGRLLDVRVDRVRLPDGTEGMREYIRHPGAVVIIPVLPSGALLFERQYRYPLQRAFIELPAGKIDPGESPLATAQRELLEETGYRAAGWRHLGLIHTCISYSTEGIEIFLANDLSRVGPPQLDAGEFLDIFECGLEDAIAAVRGGIITDAKTITALFWAEKILRQEWTAG
ncbi:MAG: NUDIX hydrolase [Betaproteobacteria bacterium]|nr:NUDIX hydrolase [Betaproteobacteria bacterium]